MLSVGAGVDAQLHRQRAAFDVAVERAAQLQRPGRRRGLRRGIGRAQAIERERQRARQRHHGGARVQKLRAQRIDLARELQARTLPVAAALPAAGVLGAARELDVEGLDGDAVAVGVGAAQARLQAAHGCASLVPAPGGGVGQCQHRAHGGGGAAGLDVGAPADRGARRARAERRQVQRLGRQAQGPQRPGLQRRERGHQVELGRATAAARGLATQGAGEFQTRQRAAQARLGAPRFAVAAAARLGLRLQGERGQGAERHHALHAGPFPVEGHLLGVVLAPARLPQPHAAALQRAHRCQRVDLQFAQLDLVGQQAQRQLHRARHDDRPRTARAGLHVHPARPQHLRVQTQPGAGRGVPGPAQAFALQLVDGDRLAALVPAHHDARGRESIGQQGAARLLHLDAGHARQQPGGAFLAPQQPDHRGAERAPHQRQQHHHRQHRLHQVPQRAPGPAGGRRAGRRRGGDGRVAHVGVRRRCRR
ncbi:MAG: hypothetical protein U1F56_00710 [Rubrivivax sp.]